MASEFVKRDSWISKMLGRPAYHLKIQEDFIDATQCGTSDLPDAFNESPAFFYTKVGTDDQKGIECVHNLGFRLIETNVIFEKSVAKRELSGNCTVRLAEAKDKDAVMEVGRNNFIYTRFHVDSRIEKETADKLKAAWVGNFFTGQRGDKMVVAEVDGKIAGFNQLLFTEPDIATIDLIAVDKEFRRRGIALDMITHAEEVYSNCSTIRVGTQIANLPSIAVYEQIGFRVAESQYVFHRHS